MEERFIKLVHQNQMVGEDFRSQAVNNFRKLLSTRNTLEETRGNLEDMTKSLNAKTEQMAGILKHAEDNQMEWEDHVCQIHYKTETIRDLRADVEDKAELLATLTTRQDQYREEVEGNLKRIHGRWAGQVSSGLSNIGST